MLRKNAHKGLIAVMCALAVLGWGRFCFALEEMVSDVPQSHSRESNSYQKLVKEGIAVEMTVEKSGKNGEQDQLMEGEDITVNFKITDSTTGATLSRTRPAVWVDPKKERMALSQGDSRSSTCQDKIKMFMQGSLSFQPVLNLNTYYILTLNDDANISVIDPMLGLYTSKMITQILLKSPGSDWTLTEDGKRLFVSMPGSNEVAVVSTDTWKVITNLEVGRKPVRMALQPDEKYVWVGMDSSNKAESGVVVIDTNRAEVVARIQTGAGHHEVAFSDDSLHAFITNQDDGTLSVVSTQELKKIRDVPTGAQPVSLAYSKVAGAVYVAHESDGMISVVDGRTFDRVAMVAGKPGLKSIRFSPDGRWAFAVSQSESTVQILDSSDNTIAHSIPVESRPDQVSFSPAFAYIRSLGSDQVNAIQLSLLDKAEAPPALKFPAGRPAENAKHPGMTDIMVPTPEGDTVLIANPAEKTIYYYMEGMLAPMGSFQTYGNEPRGILIVDKSLRETAQGVYSTSFKLPAAGEYDVAFLLDAPLTHHCFTIDIKHNPSFIQDEKTAVRIEMLSHGLDFLAGREENLLLKVTDAATGGPKDGIEDLRALLMMVPGTWQARVWAKGAGDGVYELEISPPAEGLYYLSFECSSQGLKFSDLPSLQFTVVEKGSPMETAAGEEHESSGLEIQHGGH